MNRCLIDKIVRFCIFNILQLNFLCRLPRLELPIIFKSLKFLESLVNTKCWLIFMYHAMKEKEFYLTMWNHHFVTKTSDFSKTNSVEFTDSIEFVEINCKKDCCILTCCFLCKYATSTRGRHMVMIVKLTPVHTSVILSDLLTWIKVLFHFVKTQLTHLTYVNFFSSFSGWSCEYCAG